MVGIDEPSGEAETVFGITLGDANAEDGGHIGIDLVLFLGVIAAVEDVGGGLLGIFSHHQGRHAALVDGLEFGLQSGHLAAQCVGGGGGGSDIGG